MILYSIPLSFKSENAKTQRRKDAKVGGKSHLFALETSTHAQKVLFLKTSAPLRLCVFAFSDLRGRGEEGAIFMYSHSSQLSHSLLLKAVS